MQNGLLKVKGCAECERLWQEYSVATKECIKILSNHQIAALRHDRQAIERLDAQYLECEGRRANIRSSIVAHGREAHTGRALSAGSAEME